MLVPSVGDVMLTTGASASFRFTFTEAVPVLFEASVQLTVRVFGPKFSGRNEPLAKLQTGVAPVLSVAVYVTAISVALVEVLFAGAVIVTTGATLSSRVTETEALLELFEPSVQLTTIVFAPKPSA